MSNKYTKEQREIISKGKKYFKSIREINKEKKILEYEYDHTALPKSIQYDAIPRKNNSEHEDQYFISYVQYSENLLTRIKYFDEIISNFWIITLNLKAKQRHVIHAYVNTSGYTEMINLLEDKYHYCENTYTREIPNICIELSKYIDYDDLKMINEK